MYTYLAIEVRFQAISSLEAKGRLDNVRIVKPLREGIKRGRSGGLNIVCD